MNYIIIYNNLSKFKHIKKWNSVIEQIYGYIQSYICLNKY